MNGWNNENGKLREEVVKGLNLDVVCVSETHLMYKETINIEGYVSFVNN